jgi:hypothetical protein
MSEPHEPAPRAIAERLRPLIDDLTAQTEGVGLDGASHDLSADDAARLMHVAVRLFVSSGAETGQQSRLGADDISTTEVVSAITALMEAQNLNTFDLAVWQSKLRRF